MSAINYTVETNPTSHTNVLVIQTNGAEYICKNKAEALAGITTAQKRFDEKTDQGLTLRTPRAEIKELIFISAWGI